MDEIVSFDIWDTILKRKCHPEEIKLFTAKYILQKYNSCIIDPYKDIYSLLNVRNIIEAKLCKKNEESGYDAECRILEVFDHWQNQIFKNSMSNISKELLDIELKHEIDMIYLNPDIVEFLEKYKNHNMYCISDFYMGENELKQILSSVGLENKFKKIYSSADYLLTKKTGNLYSKMEADCNINPIDHIHIGDNIYSDIKVANEMGIKTIQIKNNSIFPFMPLRNRSFNFNLDSLKKEPNTIEERLYNIGLDLSPLIYFFVNSIISYSVINDVKKIYYLTREGETFIKVHEIIKNNSPYGVKIPECDILEVSRMATFAPSLNSFSISELLRLWSQYRCQSIKTLFKTLNINIDKYTKYFEKYNINIKENIIEPWFNIKIRKLFEDKEFIKLIEEDLQQKRLNLYEYFKTKDILKDKEENIFLVDIGWRGTIQDNLSYIFKEKQFYGFYYALFDFYNLQPENTHKMSFIDNKFIRDTYLSPIITLFEMLFNPDSGSVVDYRKGISIRKIKTAESKIVKKYISYVQQGLFNGSEIINEYLKYHPFESSEFNNYVYDIIKNLKTKPPKDLVTVYYSLVHNDTFGTGNYVYKSMKLSKLERMNLFKCRNLLRKESWKEAFIIQNKLTLLNNILKFKSNLRKFFRRIR